MSTTIVLGVISFIGVWMCWKALNFIISIITFIRCYKTFSALLAVGVGGYGVGSGGNFGIDLNALNPFKTELPAFEKKVEVKSKVEVKEIKPKEEVKLVRISRTEAMADNLCPNNTPLILFSMFVGLVTIVTASIMWWFLRKE